MNTVNLLFPKTQPFKCQPHKMVKHTQMNCLSVFDYFVGLALKGLINKGNGKIAFSNSFRYFFQIFDSPEEIVKLVALVIIFGCLKLLVENLVGYLAMNFFKHIVKYS